MTYVVIVTAKHQKQNRRIVDQLLYRDITTTCVSYSFAVASVTCMARGTGGRHGPEKPAVLAFHIQRLCQV
jgi:hypothetical protein